MSLANLSDLDKHYQGEKPPPLGHSPNMRTFFSPIDDVHGVLVDLLTSATHELDVAMYGFDDDELAAVIKSKMSDPSIAVRLTLDSSQAGGVHEKTLLAAESYPSTVVAVGRSEKGAIMHQKMVVIDGLDVITGSTNWSTGGETLQDNQLTVIRDAGHATKCRARISAIHAHMLATAKPAPSGGAT